jgi:hypothetical protein
MNKGAIALALRFVGYLSSCYGLDSVGADAQWPELQLQHVVFLYCSPSRVLDSIYVS